MRDAVWGRQYPNSLASIVDVESGGRERIPENWSGVNSDMYGPFDVPTEGLLAPGCNYAPFALLLEEAALAAGVPLHLYDTVILVAPKVPQDLCDWLHMADRGCSDRENGYCRIWLHSCRGPADVENLARLWALNRGVLRSGRLPFDHPPLFIQNEPIFHAVEGIPKYSPPYLMSMGYVAATNVVDVRGPAGHVSSHIIYDLNACTTRQGGGGSGGGSCVRQVGQGYILRVWHPTTGAPYYVTAVGGSKVYIHSLARGSTGLELAVLQEDGEVFVDFAREFSVQRSRCSSSDAACLVRVSFGCSVMAPAKKLLWNHTAVAGWMRHSEGVSQVLLHTGALIFSVESAAVGACAGDNVTVSASSNRWCVEWVRLAGGRHQSSTSGSISGSCSAFEATVPIFLMPGDSCTLMAHFARVAHDPPLVVAMAPLIHLRTAQGNAQDTTTFVLAEYQGRGCLDGVGSFDIVGIGLSVVAKGRQPPVIAVNITVASKRRSLYCQDDMQDIQVSFACATGEMGHTSIDDNVATQVSGILEVPLACWTRNVFSLELVRSFGKRGLQFSRRAEYRSQDEGGHVDCGSLEETEIGPLLNNGWESIYAGSKQQSVLSFSVSIKVPLTLATTCNLPLWTWVLEQQLDQPDAAHPVYPRHQDYTGGLALDHSGSTSSSVVGAPWVLEATTIPDGISLLDTKRQVVMSSRSFHIALSTALWAPMPRGRSNDSWPTVPLALTFQVSGPGVRKTFDVVQVGVLPPPCVRNPPYAWCWCQMELGNGGAGVSRRCFTQIYNDDRNCPAAKFRLRWFGSNGYDPIEFPHDIRDHWLKTSSSVGPDEGQVLLVPGTRRTWDMGILFDVAPATGVANFSVLVTDGGDGHHQGLETRSVSDSIRLGGGCDGDAQPVLVFDEATSGNLTVRQWQTVYVHATLVKAHASLCTENVEAMFTFDEDDGNGGVVQWLIGGGVGNALQFSSSGPDGTAEVEIALTPVTQNPKLAAPLEFHGTVFIIPWRLSVRQSVIVTVLPSSCVPGPVEYSVRACSEGEVHPLGMAGQSRVCGTALSKDSVDCEPSTWTFQMIWNTPNLDPSFVYVERANMWDSMFSFEGDDASLLLHPGVEQSFEFRIAHKANVVAGLYTHQVALMPPDRSIMRISHQALPAVNITIQCPPLQPVQHYFVEQFTPLFHPLSAVSLSWLSPCRMVSCCENVTFDVIRNDQVIASGLRRTAYVDSLLWWRSVHRYRVELRDSGSGATSPSSELMCAVDLKIRVEFPNLVSFALVLGGVFLFAALMSLIIVLIFKTRKIDLEIRRLQKVAELHSIHQIDSHYTPNEDDGVASPTPMSPGGVPMEQPILVKAMEAFDGAGPDELPFNRGDVIRVTRRYPTGWWRGQLNGVSGLFPAERVRELPPPLPREAPGIDDDEAEGVVNIEEW